MTCIAYDGQTLAADKRNTSYGYPSTVTKIRRMPDGRLCGACGDGPVCVALIAWAMSGLAPGDYPAQAKDAEATLVVIGLDGKVASYAKSSVPMYTEDAFYAMGSGRDYALAAMHLGYSAQIAVEVACALDVNCGNGIDTLEVL